MKPPLPNIKVSLQDLRVPPKNPLFLLKTENLTLFSKSAENLESISPCQMNFLKDLNLPKSPIEAKHQALAYTSAKAYFDSSISDIKDFALSFCTQNNKISPLINFFSSILNDDMQEILNLASQGEPNAQIVLFLEYCLHDCLDNALEIALNFLKNFGLFPLYSGHFLKVSAISLILFLFEIKEEKGQLEEKIKGDLLLGEPFLRFLNELMKPQSNEAKTHIIRELIERLESKKSLRNASFLLAEFTSVYEKTNENKIKENLEESIEKFSHEIANYRYYNIFLKENIPILQYFSWENCKKWLFPEFLNILCENYLIESNEKEAFRFHCLSYLFGDLSNLGILFNLSSKAKNHEFAYHITQKMKETQIEGYFIKEVQCLIKLKFEDRALKLLKEKLPETEFEMANVVSKYVYLNGTFLLAKLKQDPAFFKLCVLIILMTPGKMDLYGIYILRKIVKIQESGFYNKKLLMKFDKILNEMTPEVSLEYAILINKINKKPGRKNSMDPAVIYQKTLKLLNLSISELKAQIFETIQYQEKMNSLSPEAYHYNGLFAEIAGKVLFQWLDKLKMENSKGNLQRIYAKNHENFMGYQKFLSFDISWLFLFINKTKIMSQNNENIEKKEEDYMNLKGLKGFSKENIIEIDEKTCQIKGSQKKLMKSKEILSFFPEGTNELQSFQKNFTSFHPFNLNIIGYYNENNGDNISFNNSSIFLIEKSRMNLLEFLDKNEDKSLKNHDFLKILTQIAYLNVSCNLSGFHGLFLNKELLQILEDNEINLVPFWQLISQDFLNLASKWDNWFSPELFISKPGDFSKIDSWVLGLLLFRFTFHSDYWDFFNEYAESLGFNKKEPMNLIESFEIKKVLFFKNKDKMSLEFIKKTQELFQQKKQGNFDEIKENNLNEKYEKSEKFDNSELNSPNIMSPGMKSEMLSESVLSLPPSPMKSPHQKTASHFKFKGTSDVILEEKPDVKEKDFVFDKDKFEAFLLGLIHKCLIFDPEERPTPLEILFDLHKFLRNQGNISKGIFEFVPESLLLSDLLEKSKGKTCAFGNEVIIENDKTNHFLIKTKDFISSKQKNGYGAFKSIGEGMTFEGKMEGFIPKEGFLMHSILTPNKAQRIPISFEENLLIPTKKTRNDMLFKVEKKGKGIEEFEDFHKIVAGITEHKGKPFLIDLYNNHFICDYNNEGEPIFFYNPINKSSQPLIFLNLSMIFYFQKEKLLIFDPVKFVLISVLATELKEKAKISIFEIWNLMSNEPKIEIFSINGFKFIGSFLKKGENQEEFICDIIDKKKNEKNEIIINEKTVGKMNTNNNEKPYENKNDIENPKYDENKGEPISKEKNIENPIEKQQENKAESIIDENIIENSNQKEKNIENSNQKEKNPENSNQKEKSLDYDITKSKEAIPYKFQQTDHFFKGTLHFNSIKVEFSLPPPESFSDPFFLKVFYPNGDNYEGEIMNGKYCGQGKYFYKNLFTFIGHFSNDIFCQGIILYHNSRDILKYEGEVIYEFNSKSYLKHGQGKLLYSNGNYYEGGFSNDLFQGKGIFYDSKIKTLYEGDFIQGIKHGEGVLKTNSGDYYTGGFREDRRCGFGKEIYRNKDIYEGGFKQGKREGNGIYVSNKGGYYQGTFSKDFKNGDGMIKTENNEKFVVKFYNDLLLRKKKVKDNEKKEPIRKVLSLI